MNGGVLRGRQIAQGAMGPVLVVVGPPCLDDGLGVEVTLMYVLGLCHSGGKRHLRACIERGMIFQKSDEGELTIQESDALDRPSQIPHQYALASLRGCEMHEAAGELLQGRGAHKLRRGVDHPEPQRDMSNPLEDFRAIPDQGAPQVVRTLATPLIDDGEHAEYPTVGQLIMHEIHAPPLLRARWRGRGPAM